MSFSANHPFDLPDLPPNIDCSNKMFSDKLADARVEMAELKGYTMGLPQPMILLRPSIIQESVASSEIENINTTVENVFQQQLFPVSEQKAENKEVLRYADAVLYGDINMEQYSLSSRLIRGIHKELLLDKSNGYRTLQNQIENSKTHEIIYTPPRAGEIDRLISNWATYLHNKEDGINPLIKCAIAHYQFEAIHPFGDGNGRTGRILIVLYLNYAGLLDFPILYISGFINKNRTRYYELLQNITEKQEWYPFIEFMIDGFWQQARETKMQVFEIMGLFFRYKKEIKEKNPNIYSADLVELLFSYPILTPVKFGSALGIHYTTATRYLKALTDSGFLKHSQSGKYQLYGNYKLMELLKM